MLVSKEQTAEAIAELLFKLHDDAEREAVAQEALTMAARAAKGWWEIPGRPYFNSRMAALRSKLRKERA